MPVGSINSKIMKIYHNPRCTKSRETLQLINNEGKDVEIIEYLKNPPSVAELTDLLKKLGIKATDLLRKGEKSYKEQYKGKTYSEKEWIKIMVEQPTLIERPIVVKGDKAIIGRPPEKVKSLF